MIRNQVQVTTPVRNQQNRIINNSGVSLYNSHQIITSTQKLGGTPSHHYNLSQNISANSSLVSSQNIYKPMSMSYDQLVQENQRLNKILETKSINNNNESIINENKELKDKLQKEKDHFEQFKQKVMLVIDENEKLQKIYENLSQNYLSLEQQMSDSNAHKTDLAQENQEKTTKIQELQEKLKIANQENELAKEIENKDNVIQDLTHKLDILIDENEKLSQIIQQENHKFQDNKFDKFKDELMDLVGKY